MQKYVAHSITPAFQNCYITVRRSLLPADVTIAPRYILEHGYMSPNFYLRINRCVSRLPFILHQITCAKILNEDTFEEIGDLCCFLFKNDEKHFLSWLLLLTPHAHVCYARNNPASRSRYITKKKGPIACDKSGSLGNIS